jgi:hypothetical protein
MRLNAKTSAPSLIGLSLAAAVAIGSPALAHHSAAMYDFQRDQTVSGVVKEVYWVNPHISFDLLADPKPGAAPIKWTVAGSSPGVMSRSGWSKRSLQPGDHIQVEFAPLRDGTPGGALRKVVLPDGKVLTWSLDAVPGEAPR